MLCGFLCWLVGIFFLNMISEGYFCILYLFVSFVCFVVFIIVSCWMKVIEVSRVGVYCKVVWG